MRRYVLFAVVLAILALPTLVSADAISDPQMRVDPLVDGAFGYCPLPGGPPPPGFVAAQGVTLPFNFSIEAGKTFYCFQNLDNAHPLWPDLTVTLPALQFLVADVQCSTDGHFFATCVVNPDPENTLFARSFFWSGGNPIGFGASFGFDVSPPGGGTCPGPGCWPTGTSFTVSSSVAPIPEPATLILVGSGAAALIRRRRVSKHS